MTVLSVMQTLIRYGLFPLMLIGGGGTAIWIVQSPYPNSLLLPLLLVAITLVFIAERILPYNPEFNRSHGDLGRDICHFIVNKFGEQGTLLLLPLLTLFTPFSNLWPSDWQFAIQVVFAVIVLDLGITLAHYWSHRVPLLWRFHAVHHSVKRFYGFNGLMKHPLHQAFETGVGATPLVILGIPFEVAVAMAFFVAIQLLLQHSNADTRLGPFKYLFAANEVHRFHHRKEKGIGDVNFGLFLAAWDHLLGTFHYEKRSEPFASQELGIGSYPDYPQDYWNQLLEPFRNSKKPDVSGTN